MANKNSSEQIPTVPETSLIGTIGKSDSINLAIDSGEVLLDQLLNDGPVKDIPIIGSVVKVAKAGIDIS